MAAPIQTSFFCQLAEHVPSCCRRLVQEAKTARPRTFLPFACTPPRPGPTVFLGTRLVSHACTTPRTRTACMHACVVTDLAPPILLRSHATVAGVHVRNNVPAPTRS